MSQVSLTPTAAASTRPSRFLDLRALAALENMRFVTRHQIEGSYSGRHDSRVHGGAGEFVDFREHAPGEDLRRLDWKVLARTGRAYTRLFQDETNLLCTLAIDASASMLFGTPSKLEYVQYLATSLSHLIARQQDQVGLAVISEGLGQVLLPGSTQSHVTRLHQAIEELSPRPVTNLAIGLRDLFGRLSRRGVLVVMSDFLVDDLESLFASLRLFWHRRWEVVLLHVIDPEEEHLPRGTAYRLEGLENEGHVDCSPAEVGRLYEERFAGHLSALRSLALGQGCDYRRISTAIPYLQTLGSFLVERRG